MNREYLLLGLLFRFESSWNKIGEEAVIDNVGPTTLRTEILYVRSNNFYILVFNHILLTRGQYSDNAKLSFKLSNEDINGIGRIRPRIVHCVFQVNEKLYFY